MPDIIETIAEYFTGPAVPHNSICLSLPSPHNIMARRFFDTRAALGINGYDTTEDAVKAITERLSEPRG